MSIAPGEGRKPLSYDAGEMQRLRAPTAVRVLDMEQPLEPLRLRLPDGRPYRYVMVVLRHNGRPLAQHTLSLDHSGHISASDLEASLASVAVPEDLSTHLSPIRPQSISVVVAACTGSATLVRCIHSILRCDYERCEVIVVDNRPQIGIVSAIVEEHFTGDARVRCIHEGRPGLAYARNAGLQAADGELVVFTDEDIVADEAWLRATARAFHSGAACVTGLILPLEIETPAQALFEQFAGLGKGLERRSFRLGGNGRDRLFPYAAGAFGSGANTALRKSVALRLGGFDVALGTGTVACGGEDLDLYVRLLLAGEELVYEPSALIFHCHPSDHAGVQRRAFHYGVGLTAMLTKQLLLGPRRPLLRAASAGVSYLLDPMSRKNQSRGGDYPRALARRERLGMLVGPLAYARSAVHANAHERCRAGESASAPSELDLGALR